MGVDKGLTANDDVAQGATVGLTGPNRALRRLPRTEFEEEPRYLHPHGYVLERETREWSLGGMTRGAAHQWAPKHWWVVRLHAATVASDVDTKYHPWFAHPTKKGTQDIFLKLSEARAWCDQHPREGWTR